MSRFFLTRDVLVKQQQIGEERDASLIREQLLLLALDWDAIDVAKEQIIKDDLNNLTVRIDPRSSVPLATTSVFDF